MLPSRAITSGPKHHWFGYYDKLQFDPSARYALGMEVDFEHRAPTPHDVIRVGMVDLSDRPPLDRTGGKPRLGLAGRLYAPVAAPVGARNHLE